MAAAGVDYRERRENLAPTADDVDDLFAYVATHGHLDGDENTIEYFSDDDGELDDPAVKTDRKNAVRAVRGVSGFIQNRVGRTMRNCDVDDEPLFLDSQPGRIAFEVHGNSTMNDTIMRQASNVFPDVDTRLQSQKIRRRDRESGAVVTKDVKMISFDAKRAIHNDRQRRRIGKSAIMAGMMLFSGFSSLYYVYHQLTSEYTF